MMKLELKPEFEDAEPRALFNAKHAGCTKDGQLAWVYTDSLLEIYLSDSDEIVASWRFGKSLHDNHTKISCVTDFKHQGSHMLLVATSNLSEQGTLCLFSVAKKKVIRAVEFPQRITALEVLFSHVREDPPSWIISRHLNFFCGLAAVGTEGGYLYLTDLCLDDVLTNHTTEVEPKKLFVTGANLVDPKAKRDRARSHNKHLALLFDDQCHRQGEYYYRRQDDSIQKVFDEVDVHVTCLKYLSQAGILAIGFSFGCFQMWRLHSPSLDYSSRFKPGSPAVSHFLLHEPENDPRKLLYLWIAHDDSILEREENRSNSIASISLYQLCFGKKDFYPNFGLFYDDLETVYFWMDHVLSLDPYSSETRGIWSSHLIKAYTISNPLYTPLTVQANDSFEEGLHSHDQSLSVFVWRVDSKQGSGTSQYWMAIFDLNRWYHAQMPHTIRCAGTVPQVCSFWAVYRLDEVAACSSPPTILDVHVTGNNVVKFMSSSSLPPLEHSYPSSLEFSDVHFITSQKIIRGHCLGWQGQILQNLAHNGANYLVWPADFFHECLRARLVPQYYDSDTTMSLDRKRHALLNLSLDYCLTPALVHQCVDLWADGEYAQMGCSLKFLLDWAWACVVKIKEKLDSTCELLFDWSGQQVSSHTQWTLQHQHRSLTCLNQIFTIFLSLTSPLTETGELELELRQATIKLLIQHYEVLLWCLSQALLPEVEEGSTKRRGQFAYPVSELMEVYHKRRQEMSKLQGVMDGYPLLLIDGLVSCEGNQISNLWENRGGNGLYPPPSMQAAVYLFLLEDISLEVKQAVMLYLLQDLAAVCDDQSEALVASFLQRFMISPSLAHKVQGIWFLDHHDYEEGLRQLVSPNVCHQDWTSWMDVAVVNTLLAQGEARTATCFVHSGHSLGETSEEQKLMISVLVRNGNVSQAVEFLRRYVNGAEDCGNLMPHLLKECHENKLIGQLLQLHFKPHEEIHIEQYMRERTEPNSLEPLFLYYLHSARFVQAYQLNEEMNRVDRMEASLAAQEKSTNRNCLMNAYLKVLPDITRKLIVEKQHKAAFLPVKRLRVTKPTPLSTVVHRQNQQAMSRASFVLALMDKVEEAMEVVEEALEETPELLGDPCEKGQNEERYLKTPLTPRAKTFLSSPSKAEPPSEVSESRLPTNPLSAAKQRTLAGEEAEETEGYKSLHALTMECLSVLKTPSKGQSYRSPKVHGLVSSQIKTPQSILKVRRISRTSLSKDASGMSQWKLSSPHSQAKKLGFSQSDHSVVSTPSPSLTARVVEKTPLAVTPKHLRFVGLSPTPSPSPAVAARELTRSASEDSDDVWTDAMETSVDEEFKGLAKERNDTNTGVKDKSEDGASIDVASHGAKVSVQQAMEVSVETDSLQKAAATPSVLSDVAGREPILHESPPDRYKEAINDLVRPDLMSPWKHDSPIEDSGVGKKSGDAEDEEISFNLSRHGYRESGDRVDHSAGVESQRQEKMTSALPDSSPLRHTIESVIVSSIKAHSPEISASETVVRIEETSPVTRHSKSVHIESRSYSQTLRIDTSESMTVIPSTPEKRKREPESPPMTPPSSKMAKLSELAQMQKRLEQHPLTVTTKSPSLPAGKASVPSQDSDTTKGDEEVPMQTKLKSSLPKSPSPKKSKPDTKYIAVAESKDEMTASSEVHSEIAKEDFISAEEFLQSKEIKDADIPVSPSRRKSRRINPDESTVEPSSSNLQRQSLRRATASKQTLAVWNEFNSLVESAKPTQRQRGRSKTPEPTAVRKDEGKDADPEGEDNVSRTHSLRRSQRHSKTPERVIARTLSEDIVESQRTRRQSKTPERRMKKGNEEQRLTTNGDSELPSHGLRRSSRHSKTPERSVISKMDAEESAAGGINKTSTDINEEGSKNVEKSEMHTTMSEVTSTASVSLEDPLGKPEEVADESFSYNLRRSRHQSKTPECAPEKIESSKEEQAVDEVGHRIRRSTRQSKTPERIVKKAVAENPVPEVSESETRRSRRQSKTPERKVKQNITRATESGNEESDDTNRYSFRHPIRKSQTPERVLKRPAPESSADEEEMPAANKLRHMTRRQSKTPERRKRGTVSEVTSSEKEDVSEIRKQDIIPEEEAKEASESSIRRSQRHTKTPERLISSIEGSLTKSDRPQKSPEKLNTPEIETLSSLSSPHKKQQLNVDSPATPPQHLPEEPTPKTLIPTRKSTRPIKSPERLNTDEIEPVEKSISPNRSSVPDQKSPAEKVNQKIREEDEQEEKKSTLAPGIPPSPGRQSRSRRDRRKASADEPEPMNEWSEELPPLRLEMEDEGSEEMDEDAQQETSASFVFSAPVRYSTRSHDSQKDKAEPVSTNTEAAFSFSSPPSAADKSPTTSTSQAENTESANSASERGSEKTRIKKKKKLYHLSPNFIEPFSESETKRVVRGKTKRESMRESIAASTSSMRRYSRGSGPLTRRVRPSSKS